MKIKYCLLLTILLVIQSIFSLHAQTTSGTEFWLTFGRNYYSNQNWSNLDLQIRIVSGDQHTEGSIYFTYLDTEVSFNIGAQEVYTYNLSIAEKQAVYNYIMGTSYRSIYITANYPVTVYAINQYHLSTDATNIFPVSVLDTAYYQISYTPTNFVSDAYAVIATEDNTKIFHNGDLIATLQTGQVYYHTFNVDMTGAHITANYPVAFFALSPATFIPSNSSNYDCLMQQLAPVNTWGKKFFVPVSHLTRDRIRIVASENNTNITQIGGEIKSALGSQMSLTHLQNGQFVELDVFLDSAGCYIQSDKPVGVCTYLTGRAYNNFGVSDPAQAWLPSIEQSISNTMIAPFIPTGTTNLTAHFALIMTPTTTKTDTKVSIGGATLVPLSGGTWYDNDTAKMSFYTMPLTNNTASYYFTNDAGFIIMCYGVGNDESYYYLAGSAMRDLQAAFYANNVYHNSLKDTTFCDKVVNFRAEVEGLHPDSERIKWFFDDVEDLNGRDHAEWSKTYDAGEHHENVDMVVRFQNGEIKTISALLNVKVFWTKIKNIRH